MASVHGGERDERQREFRRMVSWSAVAHVCLLGLAVVSPRSSSNFDATQVIAVDLVSLPAPARAASRPPPKAPGAPSVPAEKPPPPKPKQVVLPKNAERDPSKPKPEPKPAPKETPPEPAPEKDLDDLLAEMREDAGEDKPSETPPTTTAVAPTGVPNSGASVRVSPEVMAWMRKAKIHVRRAWVVPPGFRAEALETHVVVELDASGAVVGSPRVVRRSGNPWFDEGVVRGIEKSSPLPPPPRAGEWDFVFLPEDSY